MYFARFACGETEFVTAALQWSPARGAPDQPAVPAAWQQRLQGLTRVDPAVRIAARPAGGSVVTLLLTAGVHAEAELRAACDALVADGRPAGLRLPRDGGEYDALVEPLPASQLRVNPDGYHHAGRPLACDFRLYNGIVSAAGRSPVTYQVNLRPYRPSPEVERHVLKHLAFLDLERPFSEGVRGMQRLLARRLLEPGWVADEYLYTDDPADLPRWTEPAAEHFRQTAGRLGFPEAPLEAGDFAEFLTTGCHTLRDASSRPTLQTLAAKLFSRDELALLCELRLFGTAAGAGAAAGASPVFISYASADYPTAAAVCRDLEARGLRCWIAPRDINTDVLPYPEAITRALSQASALVVILSETANLSVHIPRELDLALERRLTMIPLRLQSVVPAGQLNYLLRTCQWLDVHNRDWADAMGELVGRLHAIRDRR